MAKGGSIPLDETVDIPNDPRDLDFGNAIRPHEPDFLTFPGPRIEELGKIKVFPLGEGSKIVV